MKDDMDIIRDACKEINKTSPFPTIPLDMDEMERIDLDMEVNQAIGRLEIVSEELRKTG